MAKLSDAVNKKQLIDDIIEDDLNCMTHQDLIRYYEENRANELWEYDEEELEEMLWVRKTT